MRYVGIAMWILPLALSAVALAKMRGWLAVLWVFGGAAMGVVWFLTVDYWLIGGR